MSDLFKRIKWSTLLSAVLTLVIGIFLLARPDAAVVTISLIVGWMLLISGVVSAALFFAGKTFGFCLSEYHTGCDWKLLLDCGL